MAILIPRKKSYWYKKPIGPQQIDHNHWAAYKLYDYWLLDANNPAGLVTGDEYSILGSTIDVESDRIITNGSGDYLDMGNIPISSWDSASFLIGYEDYVGATASFSRLFSVAKDGGDDIRIMPVSSTAANLDWDDGAFTRQGISGLSSQASTIVLSHTGSSNEQYTYSNGESKFDGADTLDTTGFVGTLRVGRGTNTAYIKASYIVCVAFKEALSREESQSLSEAPYQLLRPKKTYFLFPESGAAGAYTLACDSGTYTVTGTGAGLVKVSDLTAESGAYVYTGTALDLIKGVALTAESGAYIYTGTIIDLVGSGSLVMESGTYNYTGTDTTLTYNAIMSADSGGYTYTGTAVNIITGSSIQLDSGSYAVTGTDIAFNVTSVISMESGEYNYIGNSVSLAYSGAGAWTTQPDSTASWAAQSDSTTTWTIQ